MRWSARAVSISTALRSALEDLARQFPGEVSARPPGAVRRPAEGGGSERWRASSPTSWRPGRRWRAPLAELETFQREALLANPLLDFEQLLVLKRVPLGGARRTSWEGFGYGEYLGIPRQSSWNYGTMPNVDQWTNEIAVLSPVRPEGKLATLYKPPGTRLVNDLELHWDARQAAVLHAGHQPQLAGPRAGTARPRRRPPAISAPAAHARASTATSTTTTPSTCPAARSSSSPPRRSRACPATPASSSA